MLQKIKLNQIQIYAHHGCFAEENTIGAYYLVDLDVKANLQKAMQSDDLSDTINYATLNQIVHEQMAINSNLLEHVIGRVFAQIKLQLPQVAWAKMALCKISPPMPGQMQGVWVEAETNFKN